MPRSSRDGNIRKLCGCARWKECAHPFYIDYQEKGLGRYRPNLDNLIGRHPVDVADARAEARRAIVAWREGRDPRRLQPGDRPTLDALMAEYNDRKGAALTDQGNRRVIARTVVEGRPFGRWPAADVTGQTLELFRAARPAVAANRNLAYLRALANWAVLHQLLPASPFKVGHVTAVKLAREQPRTRRLQPGETQQLLNEARGLRDLVVAALETGCRLGELLSMQWSQVGLDLFLPGGKTKSKKPRRVPISTILRDVLDRRRLDPSGEALPPQAFVFGDEVGRRRRTIARGWRGACRRAGLDDLHFHDLRREAGSRWMDAGVPLATIQRWLGHANISQTSTYLAATGGGDADAMRLFEERIGRPPADRALTSTDVFSGADGSQTSRTSERLSEKTSKNEVVH